MEIFDIIVKYKHNNAKKGSIGTRGSVLPLTDLEVVVVGSSQHEGYGPILTLPWFGSYKNGEEYTMQITASSYQTATCPLTSAKEISEEKVVSSSFTVTKTKTATPVKRGNDVWEVLKEKYDIRHCTFKDLCDISNSLYSAGEISLRDHLMITFDWKKAAEGLSERYPGARTDLNWTPADGEGNREWIAEFKARASFNMKMGHMDGYVRDTKLAQILSRLEC